MTAASYAPTVRRGGASCRFGRLLTRNQENEVAGGEPGEAEPPVSSRRMEPETVPSGTRSEDFIAEDRTKQTAHPHSDESSVARSSRDDSAHDARIHRGKRQGTRAWISAFEARPR